MVDPKRHARYTSWGLVPPYFGPWTVWERGKAGVTLRLKPVTAVRAPECKGFHITRSLHTLFWNPGISVVSLYKPDIGPTPQNGPRQAGTGFNNVDLAAAKAMLWCFEGAI